MSVFAALAVLTISACSSTSSENVTTRGIHADMRVGAFGDGTTIVRVELEVGSGGIGRTNLDLAPGDTLTATANGIQKTLIKETSVIGGIDYVASFAFDDAGTLFTVAFNRQNGTSAPNSRVTLPDGFVILSPTSATTYSRNENVNVVWSPSGTGNVPSVFVSLACTLTSGIAVSRFERVPLSFDGGTASIPVAAVFPNGAVDETRLCEGSVSLSRVRGGSLDPNYGEGGQITAEQYEDGQFFVDPAT